MSCECEDYECVQVLVNPCTTGTTLPIEANQTGTWEGHLYFNGGVKTFGINVTSGQDISILTALLNENYRHEFRLYNTSGALHGCYRLKTVYTTTVDDAPVPTPGSDMWQWYEGGIAVSGVTGEVQNDAFLDVELPPIIYIDGSSFKWEAAGVTHDPETGILDFTGYAYTPVTGVIDFEYKTIEE